MTNDRIGDKLEEAGRAFNSGLVDTIKAIMALPDCYRHGMLLEFGKVVNGAALLIAACIDKDKYLNSIAEDISVATKCLEFDRDMTRRDLDNWKREHG